VSSHALGHICPSSNIDTKNVSGLFQYKEIDHPIGIERERERFQPNRGWVEQSPAKDQEVQARTIQEWLRQVSNNLFESVEGVMSGRARRRSSQGVKMSAADMPSPRCRRP